MLCCAEDTILHIHYCNPLVPPNEDIHEAAKDEDKEASVKCSSNVGEVPLGLNKIIVTKNFIVLCIDLDQFCLKEPGR